ncbi:MAG TPA: polysaccharide biosynthesis tyrosine autokinase [Anaerolineales bacterium]|nr:polysaccharide biosynthesis tyrosine autokinase [Anaerolineales bacterium]
MDLKELVNLYRRWIWLLIGCCILGLLAGFLASQMQAPVYEASTKVLVARGRQQGYNDVLPISDEQLVMTYLQLLQSRSVREDAEQRLGIEIDAEQIEVSLITSTQILQIKVEDKSAQRAVDIANTFVETLIERNETLQSGRFAVYEESLNSQIAQIQAQMDILRGQLIEVEQATVEDQLGQVQEQIAELGTQINALEQEIAGFPAILSTGDRAAMAAKQSQVEQLSSLLYLYKQIETNLLYIGRPVQGVTPDNPQAAAIQSTLGLYQELYLNLISNQSAVQLARAQVTPVVDQIEQAALPETPIRPVPLLYMALSAMIGVLIAAAAVLLMDYFDDSVRTAQNIQTTLHVPVIGQVVRLRHKRQSNEKSLLRPAAGSGSGDDFGTLRVHISRLLREKRTRTVLVTSARSGDGCTTVAANLAIAFAQAGKKVIFLDANLHRPPLNSHPELENSLGLAEILCDGLDWEEAASYQGNLTIITSGVASVSSTELLESDRLEQLLEKLEKKADVVVIDSPSLGNVDAQILASRIGRLLLVVQYGVTKISIVQPMIDQLTLMGVELLGVVLNQIPGTGDRRVRFSRTVIHHREPAKDMEQARLGQD